LKPTFVIPRCAVKLLAASQEQSVRFTDLRYFLSQFHDASFDRILRGDRLAEHIGRSGRKACSRDGFGCLLARLPCRSESDQGYTDDCEHNYSREFPALDHISVFLRSHYPKDALDLPIRRR
jgi:hypothetical protein